MIDGRIWFVGVDWASENHHVRISDCHGKRIGERVFAHGGAGLADMAAWLSSVTDGEPSAVHVAIEVPHGPVVETLLERGCLCHQPQAARPLSRSLLPSWRQGR